MTSNGFRFWSEEHLPFGANGLVVCSFLVRIRFSSGILAEVFNQLWIVNYYSKCSSNDCWFWVRCFFSVIRSKCFKTKRESKCQNELFLKYHFSGNTSVYVFITEIIWRTFVVIIDDPWLMYLVENLDYWNFRSPLIKTIFVICLWDGFTNLV